MAANKDKVLSKDWLAFHPYASPAPTDLYYLRICNEILDVLLAEGIDYWKGLLDALELKELACDSGRKGSSQLSGHQGAWGEKIRVLSV